MIRIKFVFTRWRARTIRICAATMVCTPCHLVWPEDWGSPSKPMGPVSGCGAFGSARRSEPEYLADRLSLERRLFDGELTHCEFSLQRACLDWQSLRPDAGSDGFTMGLEFCDDKSWAERGEIASALARGDFGTAYASFEKRTSQGGQDSALVAEYGPAAYSGLSLTPYPYRGPVTYKLPPGRYDEAKAWWLSMVPGAGLLYVGDRQAAASHFGLSVAFSALAAWSAYRGWTGPDHGARMTAWMDFGLVTELFWQRYYLGGMREAKRQAHEKNLQDGRLKVAAMASQIDPFNSARPKAGTKHTDQ